MGAATPNAPLPAGGYVTTQRCPSGYDQIRVPGTDCSVGTCHATELWACVPKAVAPQTVPQQSSGPVTVTVSPQISPQISPVFQQQFQPQNSPMNATTAQTAPTVTPYVALQAPAPGPVYSPAPGPVYSPAPGPVYSPAPGPGPVMDAEGFDGAPSAMPFSGAVAPQAGAPGQTGLPPWLIWTMAGAVALLFLVANNRPTRKG
jgi:hypothetical protein